VAHPTRIERKLWRKLWPRVLPDLAQLSSSNREIGSEMCAILAPIQLSVPTDDGLAIGFIDLSSRKALSDLVAGGEESRVGHQRGLERSRCLVAMARKQIVLQFIRVFISSQRVFDHIPIVLFVNSWCKSAPVNVFDQCFHSCCFSIDVCIS
jgi:hypothetical protein